MCVVHVLPFFRDGCLFVFRASFYCVSLTFFYPRYLNKIHVLQLTGVYPLAGKQLVASNDLFRVNLAVYYVQIVFDLDLNGTKINVFFKGCLFSIHRIMISGGTHASKINTHPPETTIWFQSIFEPFILSSIIIFKVPILRRLRAETNKKTNADLVQITTENDRVASWFT